MQKKKKKDVIGKIYTRGINICLKEHSQIFYKILSYGKGKNKSGPPCDTCRFQAMIEEKRQTKKERQPWLRKPRKLSSKNGD